MQTSHRFSIFTYHSIRLDEIRLTVCSNLAARNWFRSYVINTENAVFLEFFLFLIFFSQKFIIYNFWAQFSKDLLISYRPVKVLSNEFHLPNNIWPCTKLRTTLLRLVIVLSIASLSRLYCLVHLWSSHRVFLVFQIK